MTKPEFTITELAIILSALEQDKKNNPYPGGFVNDKRESAISKVGMELTTLTAKSLATK